MSYAVPLCEKGWQTKLILEASETIKHLFAWTEERHNNKFHRRIHTWPLTRTLVSFWFQLVKWNDPRTSHSITHSLLTCSINNLKTWRMLGCRCLLYNSSSCRCARSSKHHVFLFNIQRFSVFFNETLQTRDLMSDSHETTETWCQ